MRDLLLDANFENWKLFLARRQDPRFKELAKKIWVRDAFTCQYCAFQAPIALEVVNSDGNYRRNSSSNLLTACPFCAQSFFLESIGVGSFGGGLMIYLPELSQTQLNALCHVLFPLADSKEAFATSVNTILRDLKFRTTLIEKTFGEGMSDPAKFGAMLLNSQLSDSARRHLLKDVRLFPQKNRFEPQLAAWANAKATPPENSAELLSVAEKTSEDAN